MKKAITKTLLAAAIGGAMLSATPADAASVSISFGFPGIGFSYNSGGYCDSWGCPDSFWNYPIYYCPVYYDGRWYRGPFYYRYSRGVYRFWIRRGWRREAWYGPRPRGACIDRYGPPLDLDFYIWNGFNVRDEWRYGWNNYRNDWWSRRRDWDRTNHYDTNWRNWLPDQQRNYDWNRERSWNSNREWTRPDWNRNDWERKNRINRGTNAPVSPFGTNNPFLNKGGTPTPQQTPGFTPPTTNNPPADMGGRYRDRLKGVQGTQGTGGGMTGTTNPTLQPAPVVTPPTTSNPPVDTTGRYRDRLKGVQGTQGSGGAMGGTTSPSLQTAPVVTPPKPPVVTTPTTPIVTPPATNPPANFERRYRDHIRSGQGTQSGSGTPSGAATTSATPPTSNQPTTNTPPVRNKGDHHKDKDDTDRTGPGTNTPQ